MLAVILGAVTGLAQPRSAPTEARPTFDVVSVRPSGPEAGRFPASGGGPGRFVIRNVTLNFLIRAYYGMNPGRLLGGPGWAATDRFDIAATYRGSEVRAEMVAALLADRFKLRLRAETRDLPYYALVTASGAASPGAGLRPASIADCDAFEAEERERRSREGPPTVVPTGPHCGVRFRRQGHLQTENYGATTMAELAASLYPAVERVVKDETGITGRFDFEVTYDAPLWRYGVGASDAGEERTRERGPSIFVALEEQLGLKLLPRQGPVEVVVIEHAERPTPD